MSGEGKDDEERFSDLVGDVDRRVERDGRLPPDSAARASRTEANRPEARAPDSSNRPDSLPAPPDFIEPDASNPLLAYAAGVDRATFRRLRDGRRTPEVEVDLHGLASRDARAKLHQAVREARQSHRRVLLVVHGRGQHSLAGPILKAALPVWLREPPLAFAILAFAPAGAAHGGAGATLLLLRKPEAERER